MKLQDVETGQHFWAKYEGKLFVFVSDGNFFYVAGNWEGSYDPHTLELIEIIKKPQIN